MEINKNAELRKNTGLIRAAYLAAGLLLLAIGAVGIVLPLLPTTPFWILASFCLARSSQRLNDWLKATKFYRHNVQPLLDGKGMTLKAKLSITLPVWALLLLMFFRTDVLALKILAISLGVIKTIVFVRMKTAPSQGKEQAAAVSGAPAVAGASGAGAPAAAVAGFPGAGVSAASASGISGGDGVLAAAGAPVSAAAGGGAKATPPAAGKPAGRRSSPNRRLFALTGSTRGWIALSVAVKLVSLSVNIWFAFTLGHTVQQLLDGAAPGEVLGRLFLTGAAVIAVRLILSPLTALSSSRSSNATRLGLRLEVYRKLLRLETGYNRSVTSSQAVSAAIDGVEALESYFGNYLPQLFYSLLAPLVLFGTVSLIDGRSALVMLLITVLIPVFLGVMLVIARKMAARHFKSYQSLGGLFLESLQGLTTLKLFGRDGEQAELLTRKSEDFRRVTMRVLAMQLNSLTLIDLIAYGGAAAGIATAASSAGAGGLALSGAFVIVLLSVEFFLPLRLLSSYFHVAMNGISAAEKIFELLDAPEPQRGAGAEALAGRELPARLGVQFEKVSFAYDERSTVLNGISLDIQDKKTTAIVGPSGSGKSTVVSLLAGFLEPSGGRITIGGEALSSYPVEVLRRAVCLVPQNTYIFSGSIEDNLRMGKPEATESELLRACAAAGLAKFIRLSPDGLKTQVGEGGALLSGGQRQKLGIARALLRDAGLYIFDEATANVDTESESEIGQAIWEAAREKTTLIISHRLSAIAGADRIYVMNGGRIAEAGTHEELIQLKGLYYELALAQGELLKEGEVVL